MLEIITASVHRARRKIVQEASLALHPGSLLALIGPNGAGKSTALKLLSGELRADCGEARLDGLALAYWDRGELAQRRAVLSQGITLAFGFSVFDVAAMGRRPHAGCGREANHLITRAALATVDMFDLQERDYQTLSGGEQQRVQLARVLAQIWPYRDKTGYLLLDEPVAGLDPAHQHAVLDHARRWAARGIGVLAVLHDLNLAAQYADRIAIMREGRILFQGGPEAAFTAERIHSAFGVPTEVRVHPRTRRPQMVMWAQE